MSSHTHTHRDKHTRSLKLQCFLREDETTGFGTKIPQKDLLRPAYTHTHTHNAVTFLLKLS